MVTVIAASYARARVVADRMGCNMKQISVIEDTQEGRNRLLSAGRYTIIHLLRSEQVSAETVQFLCQRNCIIRIV